MLSGEIKREAWVENGHGGAKSGHFENLNLQSITDNKTCRKPVKSYFSRKRLTSRKLVFVESKTILTGKKEIAKTMNDFCISVTVKLPQILVVTLI